ncbi:MAG: hypothetical protein AVDCRST_MAG93-2016, partial [uncultured Chloroflexia bacterium]
ASQRQYPGADQSASTKLLKGHRNRRANASLPGSDCLGQPDARGGFI